MCRHKYAGILVRTIKPSFFLDALFFMTRIAAYVSRKALSEHKIIQQFFLFYLEFSSC